MSPPGCLGWIAPRMNQYRQEPKHFGLAGREIFRSANALSLPAPFSVIILEALGRAGTQAGVLRTGATARWFNLKRETDLLSPTAAAKAEHHGRRRVPFRHH